MSAKAGTPHLTKERKAKILAEKTSGIFTVENIAKENDITERTVYNIAKTTDPEVIELAEEFKQTLIKQAKRNVNKGLDIMHERMYEPSSKLSEITGAVKISHDIYRLETEQSTQNIQTANPLEYALAFIKQCRIKGLTHEEIVSGLEQLEEVDKAAREDALLLTGIG